MGNRKIQFTGTGNVESCYLAEVAGDLNQIRESFDMVEKVSTDTQFFHYRTSGYLLLSFRGTEPSKSKDILSDAGATLVPFVEGAGKVHQGFYRAFLSVLDELTAVVQDSHDLPVIICGHSLGGALATLAATWIKRKFNREVLLYTFGSPLVGDSEFVHYFTNIQPITYYRVVHHQDLVTMVPPPHSNLRLKLLALASANPYYLISAFFDPFGKPFNHLGKLVFIRRTQDNAFSVDIDRKTPAFLKIPKEVMVNETKEERPKWDRLLSWIGASAIDHPMNNYTSILGSDLKAAVDAYLEADTAAKANARKVIEYLEAELKSIRSSHTELESKILASFSSPGADATYTGSFPSGLMTPNEKMCLLEEAMQSKQAELVLKREYVSNLHTQGYKESILNGITDQKASPALKRELEFQSKHFRY